MSKLLQIFKKRAKENEKDFRQKIMECTNEELVLILKQRTYYVPEAAQLAVEEAIKRGIIDSEQDLINEDYRVKELRFSWFPQPVNDTNRIRLIKSLGRSLVFCGILPLVYGLVKLNAGNELEGSIILAFGMLWIFLSSQLLRTFNKQLVYGLLAANTIGTVFVFVHLIRYNHSPFMDFFVALVLFTLVTYGLVYVYKILKSSDELST